MMANLVSAAGQKILEGYLPKMREGVQKSPEMICPISAAIRHMPSRSVIICFSTCMTREQLTTEVIIIGQKLRGDAN